MLQAHEKHTYVCCCRDRYLVGIDTVLGQDRGPARGDQGASKERQGPSKD